MRKHWGKAHCVLLVVILLGTVSCANKEQVYEGMYQGFSSADETRRTRDPSYDPVQAQNARKQSYQDYKREQALKE